MLNGEQISLRLQKGDYFFKIEKQALEMRGMPLLFCYFISFIYLFKTFFYLAIRQYSGKLHCLSLKFVFVHPTCGSKLH